MSGVPTAGPGVAAARLTTTRGADNRRQLVYNGHPLYTLTADVRPGQIDSGRVSSGHVACHLRRRARIGKLNPSSSSGY